MITIGRILLHWGIGVDKMKVQTTINRNSSPWSMSHYLGIQDVLCILNENIVT